MELKKAVKSDIEELAQLNYELMLAEEYDNIKPVEELIPRMKNFIESEYDAYFVIHEENKAGYILVKHSSKPIYIRQFYIKPQFQRKGLGLKTIDILKMKYNTDTIDVEVMAWNELGYSFWKKAGFKLRCFSMRLKE